MSRLSSMVRSISDERFCAEKSSTGTFTSPKLMAPFQSPRAMFLVREALEEARQVVGVLFLFSEDLLQHASRGGILFAEVADHLAIAVDGDALGDEVFLDHVLERVALDVFGVAARGEPVWRKVRRAAELGDALGDLVGVLLLFLRVLQELGRHAFGLGALVLGLGFLLAGVLFLALGGVALLLRHLVLVLGFRFVDLAGMPGGRLEAVLELGLGDVLLALGVGFAHFLLVALQRAAL